MFGVRKTGSVIVDRFRNVSQSGVALSRDGVQTVRRVVVSRWDRESVVRFSTPFVVLFAWLILGMLVFYVVESPAETYRHRALTAAKIANKNAAQQLTSNVEDTIDPYGGRFGPHVEEQTLVIDMSTSGGGQPLILTPGSGDDGVNKMETNAHFIRLFNRKFFYGVKDLDVFAIKISRQASPSIGHYLTLTVFYSNKTKTPPTPAKCDDSASTENAENFKWDLPGSLFFCLAVVTTIGYGDLAPSTSIGKFLCVAYAVFGVPLFLVVVGIMRRMLIRYACQLHKLTYRLAQIFERQSITIIEKSAQFYPRTKGERSGSLMRTPSAAARHQSEVQRTEVRAATGVVAIFCCCMFIVLPSIFFVYAEDWDYLSALYFSFISLTTIGFGDLIAGQKSSGGFSYGLYRVFLCVWLFLGIAFVATLIQIMQTLLERVIERIHWQRMNKKLKKKAGVNSSVICEESNAAPNSVNLLDIIDSDLLCDLSSTLPTPSSGNGKRKNSTTISENSNTTKNEPAPNSNNNKTSPKPIDRKQATIQEEEEGNL